MKIFSGSAHQTSHLCARLHRASVCRVGVCICQLPRWVHTQDLGYGHMVPRAWNFSLSPADVFPFLLSHPIATLPTAVVAAIVLPMVIKVVWRAIVIPLVLILVAAAAIDSPQTAWNVASSSFSTALHFIQGHPQLVSIAILSWLALELSTRVLPLLLLVVTFLWFAAPSKLTEHIPSVRDAASSLIPNPFVRIFKQPEQRSPQAKMNMPWTTFQSFKAPVLEQLQGVEPQRNSNKLW